MSGYVPPGPRGLQAHPERPRELEPVLALVERFAAEFTAAVREAAALAPVDRVEATIRAMGAGAGLREAVRAMAWELGLQCAAVGCTKEAARSTAAAELEVHLAARRDVDRHLWEPSDQ